MNALDGVLVFNDANDPRTTLTFTNTSSTNQVFFVSAFKDNGSEPDRELEIFTFFSGGSGSTGLVDPDRTTTDSIAGHQMSDAVIAVAAVDQATGRLEGFSSRGTSTIYTNFSTQTSIDREVLDLTAVDGVATSVPGFLDFDGTSAAAPHVAAVAALVLDKAPSLTVAQLTTRLQDSAIDLGAEGYDGKFGHGRVDALHAVNDTDTAIATLVFGDFGGDGKADLVWERDKDNNTEVRVWHMDGATKLGAASVIGTTGLKWNVEGIGDVDLDGDLDLGSVSKRPCK